DVELREQRDEDLRVAAGAPAHDSFAERRQRRDRAAHLVVADRPVRREAEELEVQAIAAVATGDDAAGHLEARLRLAGPAAVKRSSALERRRQAAEAAGDGSRSPLQGGTPPAASSREHALALPLLGESGRRAPREA